MLPRLLHHSSDPDSDPPPHTTSDEVSEDYSNSWDDDEADEGDEVDEGDEEGNEDDAERADKKTLRAVIGLFHQIIISGSEILAISTDAFNSYTNTHYNKTPYHTSALQGIGWVTELIDGHAERI